MENKEDQFTVSSDNGNGKLTYPVALLTADEETLAGNNAWDESNATYLYTTQNYWNLSPSFYNQAYAYNFCSIALTYSSYVKGEYGVRPAISLSSHSIVASGDGTGENPFIIA